jgi:hypothetical protein
VQIFFFNVASLHTLASKRVSRATTSVVDGPFVIKGRERRAR